MDIPSGNLWHSYWRCTPLSSLVGKSIQNAGSFYSYVNVYQRLSVFFYWIRSGFDLWFWVRISQIRKPWKIKVRIRGNKFITMNRSGRMNELMCKPWDHNELNKPWKEDSIWIAVYCIADLEVHALVSLNWIMNGMDEWFEWFFFWKFEVKKNQFLWIVFIKPITPCHSARLGVVEAMLGTAFLQRFLRERARRWRQAVEMKPISVCTLW